HRARLLTSSQWFLAPAMLFLVVLGIVYATDAGPALQAAAVTAITLVPLITWLSVLAHRVDGRDLARAFAAHVGGRAPAPPLAARLRLGSASGTSGIPVTGWTAEHASAAVWRHGEPGQSEGVPPGTGTPSHRAGRRPTRQGPVRDA